VNSGTADPSSVTFPDDADANTKQDIATVTAVDTGGNAVSSVDNEIVTLSNPAITVTKTLSPANQRPGPGDLVNFSISVTNTGNVALSSVATTDPWLGNCNIASIPTLAPGAVYTYSCSATLPVVSATASDDFQSGLNYTGGSGWTGSWIDGESGNPAANNGDIRVIANPLFGSSNVARVQGAAADRTLTRQVNLGTSGGTLYFDYARSAAFNNAAGASLTVSWSTDNSTFTALTPVIDNSGVNAADSGFTSVNFALPANAGGATTYIRFKGADANAIYLDNVVVRAAQVNTVSVSGTDPLGTTVTANGPAPVVLGAPPLTITKTASPAFVRNGGTLTYTVTVTNDSATTQTNVQVVDPMPSGLGSTTISATTPPQTITDNFDCGISFACGSGWSADWAETGESNGAGAGDIDVTTSSGTGYSTPNVVNIANNTRRLSRTANLTGAPSATLAFDYKRNANINKDSTPLLVEASGNNGTSWTTITTLTGTGVNAADINFTAVTGLAIPVGLLTNQFVLRFSKTAGGPGHSYSLDDIAITVPGGSVSSFTPISLAPAQSIVYTITSTVTGAPAGGFVFNNTASVTSTQMPVAVVAAVSTPYYAPNYTITKSAAPTLLVEGQNAYDDTTYTVTVVNTGNISLTPTSINDPACTLSSPAGDTNGNILLDVGETWVYTCTRSNITSNIGPANTPDTVPNTVSATFTDPGGAPAGSVSKTASANVTVVHPSIAVAPSPVNATIYAGGTVPYTYTVTNTGDWPVVNVGVTAANCASPAYVAGDTNLDGALDLAETWTYSCLTAAVNADQAGQAVQASGQAATVLSPVVSAVVPVAIDVINPAITIVKTATDSVGPAGPSDAITVGVSNNVTYRFTVTNTGDSPLTSVTVADDTCSPATYLSGDTGNDTIMNVGEAWVFTCAKGQLTQTVTNTATANAIDQLTGAVQSVGDSAVVTVRAPKLQLGKKANTDFVTVGGAVTYTYTVENTGGTDIASFTPADDDPACTLARGTDAPGDNDNVLEQGESWTYSCTVASLNSDTTNIFSVKNVVQVAPFGVTPYEPTVAIAQVFVIDPRLTVVKKATTYVGNTNVVRYGPLDLADAAVGDTVVYTYAVTGSAGPGASSVAGLNSVLIASITDDKCAPIAPVLNNNGTPGNPLDDFNVGDTDSIGQLDPGETWLYSCTSTTVTATGGSVDNTVTVVGDSPVDDDPNVSLPIASPTATDTATVRTSDPKFTVAKEISKNGTSGWLAADTAPGLYVTAGSTAFFRYVIANTGDSTLRVTSVVDDKGLTVTCPGGPLPLDLAAGNTLTCTASGPIAAGQYTNLVTVTLQPLDGSGNALGSTQQKTDPANAFGSAPGLAVTKSVSPKVYTAVGEVLTYTITAKNTGNTTLTDVAVTDALMTGETCTIGITPSASSGVTLLPNETLECIYTYTIQASDLIAPSDSVVNSVSVTSKDPTDTPITGGATVTTPGLIARDDAFTTPNDTNIVGGVVNGNDTLPAGSSFAVTTPVSVGTLTAFDTTTGTFTYDPPTGFAGVVTFVYTVCAPAPDAAICDPATVTIAVAPDAVDDTDTILTDQTLTDTVVTNDVYTVGSVFTQDGPLSILSAGSLVFTNGGFVFDPIATFAGVVTFPYQVCLPSPNNALCDTAVQTIIVGPNAVNDTDTVGHDVTLTDTVVTNDVFPPLSVFSVVGVLSDPAAGVLTFDPNGDFTFNPVATFAGVVSFTYRVCLPAPNGTVCDTAVQEIIVAPEANNDSFTTATDTNVSSTVTGNDTFAVGSQFTQTSPLSNPAAGSLTFNPDGSFVFDPAITFAGVVTFDYEVCLAAPNAALCDPATATIVVGPNAVNDTDTVAHDVTLNDSVAGNDLYPPSSLFTQDGPLSDLLAGALTFRGRADRPG
jgi:large repetitive protein